MHLSTQLRQLQQSNTPIRVAVIGAGKFGSMFLAQAAVTPGIQVAAIVDLDPQRVRRSLPRIGWDTGRFGAATLHQALQEGSTFLTDRFEPVVTHGDIDLVILRENAEGEYAPVGGRLYPGTPNETVIQTGVFTKRGTERIIRAAFEYCVRRDKKKKVTSVTKSNAIGFSMVFWDEVFEEVAADFPQIETESLLVDRVAMWRGRGRPLWAPGREREGL